MAQTGRVNTENPSLNGLGEGLLGDIRIRVTAGRVLWQKP
jgi:hypothetical protein